MEKVSCWNTKETLTNGYKQVKLYTVPWFLLQGADESYLQMDKTVLKRLPYKSPLQITFWKIYLHDKTMLRSGDT